MNTGVLLFTSCVLIVFVRHLSLTYGMDFESVTMTRPSLKKQTLQTGVEKQSRASSRISTAASEALNPRHYITSDYNDTVLGGQSAESSFSFWTNLLSSTRKGISECEENLEEAIVQQSRELRLANCVKKSLLRQVKPMLEINGSSITALNGVLEIERTDGINFTFEHGQRKRIGRNGRDEEDAMEVEEEAEETEEETEKEPQDYIADIDRLSKKLTIRIKLIPGLILKMDRNNEGFRFGVELDEKDFEDLQGRGGTRKKLKKLKRFLPLLLIPIAIQFMVLPMVLGTLKMMATKALMAGKIALMLMLFNAAFTALVPQHPEHNTRVAHDFYGYDGGIEYGAYVNRRMERDRSLRQDLPYRAHR